LAVEQLLNENFIQDELTLQLEVTGQSIFVRLYKLGKIQKLINSDKLHRNLVRKQAEEDWHSNVLLLIRQKEKTFYTKSLLAMKSGFCVTNNTTKEENR